MPTDVWRGARNRGEGRGIDVSKPYPYPREGECKELTGTATQIVGVTCDKCGHAVWLNIDFAARALTRQEREAWAKAAEVPE